MAGKEKTVLQKLSLNICSEQKGSTRFSRSVDEDITYPSVNYYRNIQTALSQRYNYLFIAYSNEIRVYQPDFPTQRVPKTAVLAFELPSSGRGGRGYIDPGDPRAINHIIVGEIGNQEILLAACDDGDVAAVSTRLIHLAAQRNIAVAQGAEELHAEDVRAFFTGNVGQSAWGLAIHKEARLFAVSANTHEITIFAFALGGEPLEENSSDSDEDILDDDLENLIQNADWNHLDGPPAPGQRASQNLQIVLSGHNTNIPNIAFCNTDGDPEGKYLISTDIEDRNYVWDIWEQKQLCVFSFTENPRPAGNYYKGASSRRGWGVACLDPFSFRLTQTRCQTFGGLKNPLRRMSHGDEYDISESVEQVAGSSKFHPAMSEIGAVPGLTNRRAQDHERSILIVAGVDYDDEESDAYDETDDESNEDNSQTRGATESPNGDQPTSQRMPNSQWTNEIPPVFDDGRHTASRRTSGSQPTNSRFDLPNRMTPSQSLTTPKHKEPDLPFQILHTSEHDICMYLNEGDTRVLCNYALHQRLPPRLRGLAVFERLNMIHQIPELGVVVIGSAVGRVAVITLTKLKCTSPTLSGFCIDWTLPLKSQEDRGIRPEAPLMGLAVSPVQGREDTDGTADMEGSPLGASRQSLRSELRKYRIMLIYADHSILSYEISRPTQGMGFEVNDRIIHL